MEKLLQQKNSSTDGDALSHTSIGLENIIQVHAVVALCCHQSSLLQADEPLHIVTIFTEEDKRV